MLAEKFVEMIRKMIKGKEEKETNEAIENFHKTGFMETKKEER